MRRRMLVSFVICGALLAVLGQPVAAQIAGVASGGPRFLWAPAGGRAATEANSADLLHRRVSIAMYSGTIGDVLREITRQANLQLIFSEALLPTERRITLHAQDITVAAALTEVLLDTGLDVVLLPSGQMGLVRRETPRTTGTISGRVTERASGAPVAGASVTVGGTRLGAITGNTGRFRIADVPAGTYELVVQHLGYGEALRSATVSEGGDVTADFALEVAALPMDEVVVTGTAFATTLRTVPNPITVLTSRDIEQKQAANITDLLRGEIPGVFALAPGGQEDYYSKIYVRGNAGWSTGGDYIKIYIDGVEVASTYYLSTIDPKSIERIEVVRGPQAAAIYGTENASGVLQIFTKKGVPGNVRPRLEIQTATGRMESKVAPEGTTPLQQDFSLQVLGGADAFSYRAGASYVTVGEWVKNYDSRTTSLSAGLRAQQGPLTAELSALWSDRAYQLPFYNYLCRYPEYAASSASNTYRCHPDYFDNREYGFNQTTLALNLSYQATPRWRHTLVLGNDQNSFAYHQPEPNRVFAADTFVQLQNNERRRRSIRYHTAYDANLGEQITARFTLGGDHSYYDITGAYGWNLLSARAPVRTSSRSGASFTYDGWRNAGYYGMAEIGIRDQLHLTLSARVEEMRNLGDEYGRPVQPRAGVAYVREVGPAEVKLRTQWGRGVRLPPWFARVGDPGDVITYLANPLIGPEEKAGWDAGVDVYWGNRASLSLTRFEEEGRNLIMPVIFDEGDFSTFPPARPMVQQYQNFGTIGIEGWELEGALRWNRFSLKANYAYSDNRIKEISNFYKPGPTQTYQAGDRMFDIPKHSGGGTLTTRIWRGSVSVNTSVLGPRRQFDNLAYYEYLYGGEEYRGSRRDYNAQLPALWRWHLRAEQAVTERLSTFLRVDNLRQTQMGDISILNVTPGRTTTLGLRLRL